MTILLKFENFNYTNADGSLKNFSLTLNKNEIRAIISKNTVDQSIFIDSLLRFDRTNIPNGRMTLNSATISPLELPYTNKIQIMHADVQLIDNLSVRENLFLNNIPLLSKSPLINWRRLNQRCKHYLNLLGINCSPKSLVKELSLENKKLIYLLKIIINDPKVLILHEPFEDLDTSSIARVKELIRQFASQDKGVLILTKHWEHALKLSDEISILQKGSIINEMSTEDAIKNPTELVRKIENLDFQTEDPLDKNANDLLEAVFKASKFLTSEYELNEILKLLINEAVSVFSAQNGSIILYDERTETVIDEFYGNKSITPIFRVEHEIIQAIINARSVHILDFPKSIYPTVILVPILSKNQVYGVLQLNFNKVKSISEKEVKYIESYARHIALAIEDTRLMGNSIFIRESHHRIKNNLQTVAHLIMLQKNTLKQHPTRTINDVLDTIINYVKSIAVVHDLISQDNLGRSIINLKEMVNKVLQVYGVHFNITIESDIGNHFIPYNKATSITLIINELLTNAFKHAFKENESGKIVLSTIKEDHHLLITITDNGKGLPSQFDLKSNAGTGLTLLRSIVTGEFKGDVEFISLEKGTSVKVMLPLSHLYSSAVEV